jgi:hypothetical protein
MGCVVFGSCADLVPSGVNRGNAREAEVVCFVAFTGLASCG